MNTVAAQSANGKRFIPALCDHLRKVDFVIGKILPISIPENHFMMVDWQDHSSRYIILLPI